MGFPNKPTVYFFGIGCQKCEPESWMGLEMGVSRAPLAFLKLASLLG